MYKDGIEHKMQTIPEPFHEIRNISHAEYFSRDTTLKAERLKKPKENNVRFLQDSSISLSKSFNSFRTFSVIALGSIALGKEILVRYRKM